MDLLQASDATYINVSDDKVMPSLETFNKMSNCAAQCRELALSRGQAKTQADIEGAYKLAKDSLMCHCFGPLWISGNAVDPNYPAMEAFFARVCTAVDMHKTKFGSIDSSLSDDEFEQTLDGVIMSLRQLHKNTQVSTLSTIGWSFVSYIPLIASFAPTFVPVAIIGSCLISELGFVRAVDVTARAAKLGINMCGISMRAVAMVVNITAKLI